LLAVHAAPLGEIDVVGAVASLVKYVWVHVHKLFAGSRARIFHQKLSHGVQEGEVHTLEDRLALDQDVPLLY